MPDPQVGVAAPAALLQVAACRGCLVPATPVHAQHLLQLLTLRWIRRVRCTFRRPLALRFRLDLRYKQEVLDYTHCARYRQDVMPITAPDGTYATTTTWTAGLRWS